MEIVKITAVLRAFIGVTRKGDHIVLGEWPHLAVAIRQGESAGEVEISLN